MCFHSKKKTTNNVKPLKYHKKFHYKISAWKQTTKYHKDRKLNYSIFFPFLFLRYVYVNAHTHRLYSTPFQLESVPHIKGTQTLASWKGLLYSQTFLTPVTWQSQYCLYYKWLRVLLFIHFLSYLVIFKKKITQIGNHKRQEKLWIHITRKI